MIIYIVADHRGYDLKKQIKAHLGNKGYEVVDLGNTVLDLKDDYPDFAKLVAEAVSKEPESRGILICGSGAGVAIVANKFKGIRAGLAVSPEHARMIRNDEDNNILTLSAQLTAADEAVAIVDIFLETPFSIEERHRRRVDKIE